MLHFRRTLLMPVTKQRYRHFGPVTWFATVLGAAAGIPAAIYTEFCLLPEWRRYVIVPSVFTAATLGILIGIAWEQNVFPRTFVRWTMQQLRSNAKTLFRIGALLLVAGAIMFCLWLQQHLAYQAKIAALNAAGGNVIEDQFSGRTVWFHGQYCTDKSLVPLANIEPPHRLHFSDTKITAAGISTLEANPGLKCLNAFGCPLDSDALAHLTKFPNLEVLDLRRTAIEDDGLAHLVGLRNLQTLDVMIAPISNESLRHIAKLTSLQSLRLYAVPVTDEGLKHLHNAKSLVELDLFGTLVTAKGVAALEKALPNCTVIYQHACSRCNTKVMPRFDEISEMRPTDDALPELWIGRSVRAVCPVCNAPSP